MSGVHEGASCWKGNCIRVKPITSGPYKQSLLPIVGQTTLLGGVLFQQQCGFFYNVHSLGIDKKVDEAIGCSQCPIFL